MNNSLPPDTSVPDVVTVPLSNAAGDFALFDAADWQAWLAAGNRTTLYLNRPGTGPLSYVAYSDPNAAGWFSYAARWIMKPAKGQVVRYRSRNRCDLRRSNLYLETRSPAKRKAARKELNYAA